MSVIINEFEIVPQAGGETAVSPATPATPTPPPTPEDIADILRRLANRQTRLRAH